MRQRRFAPILIVIVILLLGVVSYIGYQKATSNVKTFCKEIDKNELTTLIPLPKENLSHFFFIHNGYSPNKCIYALNVAMKPDYSRETEKYLNSLIGMWLINTANKKAQLLKCKTGYDTEFKSWVGNNDLELISSYHTTASTIDINTCGVKSRRLVNIGFSFPKTSYKYPITFKSSSENDKCNLEIQKVEDTDDVEYPFSCIKQSDITVNANNYGKILVQYVGEDSIKVNGRIYDDLLSKRGWVIIE